MILRVLLVLMAMCVVGSAKAVNKSCSGIFAPEENSKGSLESPNYAKEEGENGIVANCVWNFTNPDKNYFLKFEIINLFLAYYEAGSEAPACPGSYILSFQKEPLDCKMHVPHGMSVSANGYSMVFYDSDSCRLEEAAYNKTTNTTLFPLLVTYVSDGRGDFTQSIPGFNVNYEYKKCQAASTTISERSTTTTTGFEIRKLQSSGFTKKIAATYSPETSIPAKVATTMSSDKPSPTGLTAVNATTTFKETSTTSEILRETAARTTVPSKPSAMTSKRFITTSTTIEIRYPTVSTMNTTGSYSSRATVSAKDEPSTSAESSSSSSTTIIIIVVAVIGVLMTVIIIVVYFKNRKKQSVKEVYSKESVTKDNSTSILTEENPVRGSDSSDNPTVETGAQSAITVKAISGTTSYEETENTGYVSGDDLEESGRSSGKAETSTTAAKHGDAAKAQSKELQEETTDQSDQPERTESTLRKQADARPKTKIDAPRKMCEDKAFENEGAYSVQGNVEATVISGENVTITNSTIQVLASSGCSYSSRF